MFNKKKKHEKSLKKKIHKFLHSKAIVWGIVPVQLTQYIYPDFSKFSKFCYEHQQN